MRLKLLVFFLKSREGMKIIKLYKRGLNYFLIYFRDLFLIYYFVLVFLFCLFLGSLIDFILVVF